MEIRDQRANVACRVAGPLTVIDVAAHSFTPTVVVALVDRVDTAPTRFPDVLVRQEKFTDRRVEGESVFALACRIDEHHAGSIDEITSAQLLSAGPQEVLDLWLRTLFASVDGENGTYAHVDIDIRRSVHRIEDENIRAAYVVLGNRVDVIHFLRRHGREQAQVIEGVDDGGIGEFVQLLHLLAVHVGASRQPHRLGEPSLVHLAANHLARHGDLFQQSRETTRNTRELALLFDDETGQGHSNHRDLLQ